MHILFMIALSIFAHVLSDNICVFVYLLYDNCILPLLSGKRFRYTYHNKTDGPIHSSIEKLDLAVSLYKVVVCLNNHLSSVSGSYTIVRFPKIVVP